MRKKETKLIKLRIITAAAFILIFCGALAAILSWAIVFKPFEKFEHYKERLIFGDSFEIEGVNVVQIGESVSPRLYEFHYEVNGKVYISYWKIWGRFGNKYAEFDYLVSNPNYTVSNRTLALIMLPITFFVLFLTEVLVIKVYQKEKAKFVEHKYKGFL